MCFNFDHWEYEVQTFQRKRNMKEFSVWSAGVFSSGGYLRPEALLHLPELSLLVIHSNLHRILLLIDPVPPVLLATLLQQSHSDAGTEHGRGLREQLFTLA